MRAGCLAPIVLCAALCVLAAQGYAEAGERQSGFKVGERFSYRVSWIGIPVAYLRSWVVGEIQLYGRPVYHIVVSVKTARWLDLIFKVRDRFDTFIDTEALIPLRSERIAREGGYYADEVMTYDHGLGRARYHSRRNGSVKHYTVPRGILDAVGAFYWFRRVPRVRVGKRIPIMVMYDEKNWPLAVDVERQEELSLPDIGKVEALRLKPVFRKRKIERDTERLVKQSRVRVWISHDEDRIPLKLMSKVPFFGSVDAKLDKREHVLPPAAGITDAVLFAVSDAKHQQ